MRPQKRRANAKFSKISSIVEKLIKKIYLSEEKSLKSVIILLIIENKLYRSWIWGAHTKQYDKLVKNDIISIRNLF